MNNSALVVVDMLYDFIDGSLACQNAVEAVKRTLDFIDSKTKGQKGEEHEILDTFPILFIRDHHPADHSSFKEHGGIGLHTALQAPMAKGSSKVVVSGPLATPPESKAIPVNILGTKKVSPRATI